MQTSRFRHFAVLYVVLFFALLWGCSTQTRATRAEERRQSKTQSEIEKRKQERVEEYQGQVERHKKIQSKKTRKEMKRMEKKAKRWRAGKREPFYERWYYQWEENRNRRQERRKD
jgi:Ni/Co efflux regulator RcnB